MSNLTKEQLKKLNDKRLLALLKTVRVKHFKALDYVDKSFANKSEKDIVKALNLKNNIKPYYESIKDEFDTRGNVE